MRRAKIKPTRNKLDMTDEAQVRVVTKRLKMSPAELAEMVGRIGNSITAINKEVTQQRAAKLAVPAGAVIASVTVTETKAEVIMPDDAPPAT
jgi:DNA-binding XRE family transcriptional regulator